jgi:hypothetical protein
MLQYQSLLALHSLDLLPAPLNVLGCSYLHTMLAQDHCPGLCIFKCNGLSLS